MQQKTQRRVTAVAVTAALAATITAGASPASALTDGPNIDVERSVLPYGTDTPTTELPDVDLGTVGDERTFYRYSIVDKKRTDNVRGKTVIARCLSVTEKGKCTITAGVSVGVTVGVSFGLKVSEVTYGLSGSTTTTVTLSVGCASPELEAGQSWHAYPVGQSYEYRIKRVDWFGNVRYSPKLTAFIPYANGIACGTA